MRTCTSVWLRSQSKVTQAVGDRAGAQGAWVQSLQELTKRSPLGPVATAGIGWASRGPAWALGVACPLHAQPCSVSYRFPSTPLTVKKGASRAQGPRTLTSSQPVAQPELRLRPGSPTLCRATSQGNPQASALWKRAMLGHFNAT